MEREISDVNYPVKKSYYVCLKILNTLWLPVLLLLLFLGESFDSPISSGTPSNLLDWIIVLLLGIYVLYLFIYYWNDKIIFNIDEKVFSLKSKGFERSFPTNCITSIQVPVDFWHRTIFELVGNYYRLKIYTDRSKILSENHVWKGHLNNTTNFNLNGLSKEDALEIARKVNLIIHN